MNILNLPIKKTADGRVISSYWSDHFITSHDSFLEKSLGRPNLLICYGDSWTWGDSICEAAGLAQGDKDYRSQHVFASVLADGLDADFSVNAIPGIFNFWIHDRLEKLLSEHIVTLSQIYNQIYIVVVLTELGRDFEFDRFCIHLEHSNIMSWNQFCADDFLQQVEALDFQLLADVKKNLPGNCSFTVARNFTDCFAENRQILGPCLVHDCWADCLFDTQRLPRVSDQKILISFGLEKFVNWARSNHLDDEDFKRWVLKQSKVIENMIDLLNSSQYNHHEATCHPTVFGHKIWADYLLQHILENKRHA